MCQHKSDCWLSLLYCFDWHWLYQHQNLFYWRLILKTISCRKTISGCQLILSAPQSLYLPLPAVIVSHPTALSFCWHVANACWLCCLWNWTFLLACVALCDFTLKNCLCTLFWHVWTWNILLIESHKHKLCMCAGAKTKPRTAAQKKKEKGNLLVLISDVCNCVYCR